LALQSDAQLVADAEAALALALRKHVFADRNIDVRESLAMQARPMCRAVGDVAPALGRLIADVLYADVERVLDSGAAHVLIYTSLTTGIPTQEGTIQRAVGETRSHFRLSR
jgi:hypothetical protein